MKFVSFSIQLVGKKIYKKIYNNIQKSKRVIRGVHHLNNKINILKKTEPVKSLTNSIRQSNYKQIFKSYMSGFTQINQCADGHKENCKTDAPHKHHK